MNLGLILSYCYIRGTSRNWTAFPVLISIFSNYIWYLAYALADRRRKKTSTIIQQLSFFEPFWGGSAVPHPKGEAYLARIEAKTPRDLAVAQLKGLKLLLWACVLQLLMLIFIQIVFGAPGFLSEWLPGSFCVPKLSLTITAFLQGHPYDINLCRLSVLANFCMVLLHLTVTGHFIIAVCRLAGFNALRNTYNPLASRSIADFYNRLNYYFKELLVDMFFYPSYFRYFKKHPRLRLFFATLAAAGFGNLLFHALTSIHTLYSMSLLEFCISFHVYGIYALILGAAIALSQLRTMGGAHKNGSLLNTLGVLCFYCIVMILDCRIEHCSILDYTAYIGNLVTPFPR